MEQKPSLNGRHLWMDCLRLLAMIAVIVIHVVALQWDKVQLHTGDWFVVCAYNGSVRWGVLVFLMISGALFLDPQKQLPLRTIYGKYILRLIIAYFAWGALYALFAFDGSLSGFAENLITGYYHMWYLPVLAGLYAMLPLLRKITEDPKLHGYILALALVGGFLIPNGIAILQEFSLLGNWFGSLWENAGMQLVFDYSCFFVAGYILSRMELNKRWRIVIYAAGIASWLLTVFAVWFLGNRTNNHGILLLRASFLNIALQAPAMFVFGKYVLQPIHFSPKVSGWIHGAAKCSFGVYLVHPLVLEVLVKLAGESLSAMPLWLWIPALTVIVLALSLAVAWVLTKIPVVKKYLV